MPLPKKINKKSDSDLIEINGQKYTTEQIFKLRQSRIWQVYFNTLRPRGSNGEIKPFPRNTSARGLNEEDYKRHIDKLVLIKIDSKNPMNSFDDFYRTFKKGD